MLSEAQKLDIEMFYIDCPDHYSFEDSYRYVIRRMLENSKDNDTIEYRNAVYNYMDEIYEFI